MGKIGLIEASIAGWLILMVSNGLRNRRKVIESNFKLPALFSRRAKASLQLNGCLAEKMSGLDQSDAKRPLTGILDHRGVDR